MVQFYLLHHPEGNPYRDSREVQSAVLKKSDYTTCAVEEQPPGRATFFRFRLSRLMPPTEFQDVTERQTKMLARRFRARFQKYAVFRLWSSLYYMDRNVPKHWLFHFLVYSSDDQLCSSLYRIR